MNGQVLKKWFDSFRLTHNFDDGITYFHKNTFTPSSGKFWLWIRSWEIFESASIYIAINNGGCLAPLFSQTILHHTTMIKIAPNGRCGHLSDRGDGDFCEADPQKILSPSTASKKCCLYRLCLVQAGRRCGSSLERAEYKWARGQQNLMRNCWAHERFYSWRRKDDCSNNKRSHSKSGTTRNIISNVVINRTCGQTLLLDSSGALLCVRYLLIVSKSMIESLIEQNLFYNRFDHWFADNSTSDESVPHFLFWHPSWSNFANV